MSATEQKLREASERINVLEAWKRDALASLNDWHGLEALVPREFAHGRLGQAWPSVVTAYINDLEFRILDLVNGSNA